MKAENILRGAQGQLAGALVRLNDLETRLRSLAHVADDVASGVTPLYGIDANSAQALGMALEVEVEQLGSSIDQLRSGYAYLIRLASMLPKPETATAIGAVA